ncbi:glutathione S-transferase family protein [Rhizobium sp. KVB221]|uniref:Glutathione S-transferase family protein n=1 Tax=Rhizobium setariae TaxID=2801340 RepID=A0A936YJ90_9HYPH|nr:glutathione S-transferase family protein [Rhizobium setariae]MBL0371275.1 glutathione S-transferase family protein [Rhizobium setariae]
MKLLYSSTSPYSAKVRMAAHHLDLGVASEAVKTDDEPAVLLASNPLGKIPVLLREDKAPVFDSVAIMQFMNREAKGKLYPRNPEKRTEAEVLEAVCDGIVDCLIAIIYERRFRPEERLHQPWIDKQWSKVTRGLDYLNANLPKTSKSLHGGHFALAALIGYLNLRFEGQWEKGRPKLKNWPQKFEKFFPDYSKMRPQV